MEEKKLEVPSVSFASGKAPEGLPKFRVIKRGNKNKDNAPIEVKRGIRPGARMLKPGESIDWRKEYT